MRMCLTPDMYIYMPASLQYDSNLLCLSFTTYEKYMTKLMLFQNVQMYCPLDCYYPFDFHAKSIYQIFVRCNIVFAGLICHCKSSYFVP